MRRRTGWFAAAFLSALVAVGCEDDSEDKLHAEVVGTSSEDESSTGGGAEGEKEDGTGEGKPESGKAESDQPEPASSSTPPELLDPSKVSGKAPDEYTVALETTEGTIHVDVTRAWAPEGADRFYNLVKAGFYDDVAFFRMVKDFVVQFGLHGDPEVNQAWRRATIEDDPVEKSNERGTVVFATSGPNSRTTQLFINLADNDRLDGMGFAPFGKVRDGDMKVVEDLHFGYGERPSQGRIQREGNAYLKEQFPKLDYIEDARIVEDEGDDQG
jgi:peptidyl-prolyl cis-trans isomerase A (cyclophilin A)